MTMASIFENPSIFDDFQGGQKYDHEEGGNMIVEVVDWDDGNGQPSSQLVPVSQLSVMQEPRLRIIFAPLDLSESPQGNGIIWLFRYFSVPSAFLEERLRSVTHSFGALHNVAGYNCAWFHFLRKNLLLRTGNDKVWISDPRPDVPRLDQADWTWVRSGFFLRWKSSDQDSVRVTLLCFQPSSSLQLQLRDLQSPTVLERVVVDPFSLFVVVLNELSRQMDKTVWDVSSVFGEIEKGALMLSEDRESFTGLHNVAKHIVYLQEGSDALLSTLRKIAAHHSSLRAKASDKHQQEMENTTSMLMQGETGCETVRLRLRSLDKRMQNTISLSFHLVTQEGNRLLQSDSNTMTTIAFTTLIFLPMTTVSTMFGSQFFNFSDDSSIRVSKDFWIFWLISIPVTIFIVYTWYLITTMRYRPEVRDSRWPMTLLSFKTRR